MSNIELGKLALKQAINLPYLPSTIRSEMISVIRFSNENTKLLLEIESQYSWLLSSIDDAFENANDLEGIVDALTFVRLNNQKNEVIHSSIDNAIKIIEDGASSIYNPNSSYYVQNARIASLPMFNESGCSTEVPDVLYKGFFSGLKDFGKDLLKSAVKLAKADVKGAVTGGLGGAAAGAAAAGVGAGPGAATGAVAGGVGASTGQAVSDVVDSVGGSDKK
ncbi:hypothetical protein [Vibrio alfacsensis]|uniref:hypothetical protein n=1 Tax=Vibrio alfacsensis TaxID=1074311 RepID=UPI004068CB76